MPTKRIALSTSTLNSKIYAIGGETPAMLSVVEEYDPITDKWTKKADIPTPRVQFNTCDINGKIYAIGGNKSFIAFFGENPPMVTSIEVYDTGFIPQDENNTIAVSSKTKLANTWGQIKHAE